MGYYANDDGKIIFARQENEGVNMKDYFFHIFARKRNALRARSEFSGYRSAQSESEVLANLYTTYEHITVLEIRERRPWNTRA